MNKLKGKLCAFCMIFSAIVTYSDASYKTDFLKQADAIATDYQQWQESILNGEHKFVGKDASNTAKNINAYCGDLKYTPEEIEKLKQDAYGETGDEEIYKALTTDMETSALGQRIIPSILETSLRGDLEIPYWENKDDRAKSFDVKNDPEIDTNLTEGIVQLSDLVDFAHSLRTFGLTPTEFLEFYSEECEDGLDTSSKRCTKCTVDTDIQTEIKKKLYPYENVFITFVNVIRSIGNEHTYKRMRKSLLYGNAKENTPKATDKSTADSADLFNFLHLFLKAAAELSSKPNVGEETTVAQVACNWLTGDASINNYYPKVVNTLLDMMYIAHVGAANDDANKSINQVKRHILSEPALKMLNQALEDIEVDGSNYRLVGINDLRIEDDSKKVLGLTDAISDDATSFLLPVALLQNKVGNTFSTYNGAPLLMASDIVYMVKKKELPIVSMFMYGGNPISTYGTGYNLMKQSRYIETCSHDGSYNGTGVTAKYGTVANKTYSKDYWGLDGDKSLTIEDACASLIVAELFSWYTKILDVSSIKKGTRENYETEFVKQTNTVPSAHAFIVKSAKEVEKISTAVSTAYTPNTVYEGDDVYTDNHYIKLENGDVKAEEADIKGKTLVASLLNSSWGETMLRVEDAGLNGFKEINGDSEIDEIGKAEEFNTSNKSTSRDSNHSSTVHQLEAFRKALQLISNYTFPGFQPHENAYGRPLATLADGTLCEFIAEEIDGNNTGNTLLNDNTELSTALGKVGAK